MYDESSMLCGTLASHLYTHFWTFHYDVSMSSLEQENRPKKKNRNGDDHER